MGHEWPEDSDVAGFETFFLIVTADLYLPDKASLYDEHNKRQQIGGANPLFFRIVDLLAMKECEIGDLVEDCFRRAARQSDSQSFISECLEAATDSPSSQYRCLMLTPSLETRGEDGQSNAVLPRDLDFTGIAEVGRRMKGPQRLKFAQALIETNHLAKDSPREFIESLKLALKPLEDETEQKLLLAFEECTLDSELANVAELQDKLKPSRTSAYAADVSIPGATQARPKSWTGFRQTSAATKNRTLCS